MEIGNRDSRRLAPLTRASRVGVTEGAVTRPGNTSHTQQASITSDNICHIKSVGVESGWGFPLGGLLNETLSIRPTSFKGCPSRSQRIIIGHTLFISGNTSDMKATATEPKQRYSASQSLSDGTLARLGRNEGVRRMQTAERAAVIGSPDLESLSTSHVERAFLTVRQELKRFQRKGLGYSKSVEMHKHAVAIHFGVYNFVRKHHTLGTTPAVAAGLGEKPWDLEQVVEMTQAYWATK
jgi:IS1 transposase